MKNKYEQTAYELSRNTVRWLECKNNVHYGMCECDIKAIAVALAEERKRVIEECKEAIESAIYSNNVVNEHGIGGYLVAAIRKLEVK